ncbi:MAG: response regulator transcription factor [Cyanobacteria bacterium P01_D01_bin.115]
MIRILLADDQPLFREGLMALLALEDDFEIVGEAEHGEKAITLAEHLQPDVVLMDVRMPLCNGVEATRQICERCPWIHILVLTTFDEDEYVFQCLEVGALGYLLKSTPAKQVAIAIRNVQQGYSQLGPTIGPKVFSALKSPQQISHSINQTSLSQREADILRLLGQGHSNREIANLLHLTEGTVRNNMTNVFSKLGVNDRTQAALWAYENLLGFSQI